MLHLALLALVAAGPVGQTEALVSDFLKTERVAGMSAAVVRNGEVLFSQGFGHQDVQNQVKASSKTRYRLGSVSKPMATVAYMALWEQKKLDLHSSVTTLDPSLPKAWSAITPQHLMTHTSGIRHYSIARQDNGTRHFSTAKAALDLFKNDPLIYPTGTDSAYSTHAFTALAALIEKAAGQPFSTYMDGIFADAGIESLRCENLTQPAPSTRASHYTRTAAKPAHSTPAQDNSWKYAGGGMESSPEDLALFTSKLIDGKILKPATLRVMFKQQPSPAAKGQALTWRVSGSQVSHSGSQQGCSAILIADQDSGLVVTVLCNTSGVRPTTLARTILDLWSKQ
jgi:CubicO group peptidase (beta-lactamase class C family)